MKVSIYTTPTCAYCKMAKAFFEEKKVTFEEFDVSENADKAEEMIKKSGQMGVPVIVVETDEGTEELIVGFDKTKLIELLGIKE